MTSVKNKESKTMSFANLINGDCLEAMKSLMPESVNLIVTDPPYNIGNFMLDRATNLKRMRDNFFATAGWDNMSFKEWKKSMDSFFSCASKVIVKGGSMIVFMAVIKVETIIALAEKHGFYYKTTGIWHKKNPMPRNKDLQFINSNECWIYFTFGKRTGVFNNNGAAIHDFIETSVTPLSEKKLGKHPTQKPLALMRWFIQLLSNEGDTVLDPFMGSGSTGVAAIELSRNFIGVELDKEYFSIAKKRIEANL